MWLLRVLGMTRFLFWYGAVIGFVAGAGFMLVAFPFWFPPPRLDEPPPAAETLAAPEAGPQRLTFTFDQNAPGRDFIHWANGTGAFIRTQQGWMLRLDETFEAGPGPNYWLYLNTVAVGAEPAFEADAGRVKLAPLKSFKGGQNYMLPPGIDPTKFHTLTIWCESFGVYIGSAALGPPT